MAENLKVTKYRNGDNITHVTTNPYWPNDRSGAYGVYVSSEIDATTYLDSYGLLYNWYAVGNSSGLCPEGWHVPTSDEYNALNTHLGTKVGQKMKEAGTEHWNSTTTGTDSNSSGFTALPAGLRAYNNGTFSSVGVYNYLWVSDSNGSNATFWYLKNYNTLFRTGSTVKTYGFSVRCLED
jgi:uncharacterized protein (TIGR02145 family)